MYFRSQIYLNLHHALHIYNFHGRTGMKMHMLTQLALAPHKREYAKLSSHNFHFQLLVSLARYDLTIEFNLINYPTVLSVLYWHILHSNRNFFFSFACLITDLCEKCAIFSSRASGENFKYFRQQQVALWHWRNSTRVIGMIWFSGLNATTMTKAMKILR